jgi:type IV secretion system protein VirD4
MEKRHPLIIFFFLVCLLAAATAAALWLAGFFFFIANKTNPIGQVEFLTWWNYWQGYHDDLAVAKKLKASIGFASLICHGIFLLALVDLLRDKVSLHGDAKFADYNQIKKAGFFDSVGVLIGKYKGQFLQFAGSEFVLLAAPTRTGKGVSMVIPNLLNLPDSVVCTDIKLENYLITSKYRQANGQAVFLFNPFAEDGKTHRYNCLSYVRGDRKLRVTDILAVGYVFFPVGDDEKENFFNNTARNLFLGICLYLMETPDLPFTVGEVLRQSSGKGRPIKEYLQGFINERNFIAVDKLDEKTGEVKKVFVPIVEWDGYGLPPLSFECVDALNRFLSTSDNTLSSIQSTFSAPLTIWASPLVDAATSGNDFNFRELRKKRMTIYLGIPANKIAEAGLLINLFYTQLLNLNMDDLIYTKPDLKYPCNLLMDEATAAGKISIIDKASAYIAGYGLRLISIIQSPDQIKDSPPRGYGQQSGRTIIKNHAVKVVFTPKDEDADEISNLLGTYTYKAHSVHLQNRRTGTESDQRRPLMLPQELRKMSNDKQIIRGDESKVEPIFCDKIFYYKDHVFLDRLKSVCPQLKAIDNTPVRRFFRTVGFNTKAVPDKEWFERLWGSGALAINIKPIDFDLHDAIVQGKTRPLTTDDLVSGIDLGQLNIDTSQITIPEGDTLSDNAIDDFVNSFFDAIDAKSTDDDTDNGDPTQNVIFEGDDDEDLDDDNALNIVEFDPNGDDTDAELRDRATTLN